MILKLLTKNMKFQCIKNFDMGLKKNEFKAVMLYINIVMGGPAVSHSPGAQCCLNAGPDNVASLIT